MGEMQEINIEEIMQQIRAEIKEKGYTNDMLSFNDIVADSVEMNVDKFDKVLLNEEIYSLNSFWNVQTEHALVSAGGLKTKLSVFIKKVIRKLIRFYIIPIVSEQNTFNANVVRTMNLVNCYITENERLSETVIINQEHIEKLIQENNELKKKVELLEKRS